ncbi:hypothetical protein LCGC14_2349730 [marine sediment metagenome]|uniref:Uncharacterized protein n=1 Tax=marine sediment metagenome TaxID=412755 RepID=A0A0F9CX08_9ZZZZ
MEITHQGLVEALCNNCETIDCTNPIERKKISIVGIIKECRVYSRGAEASFVIKCEGFLQK